METSDLPLTGDVSLTPAMNVSRNTPFGAPQLSIFGLVGVGVPLVIFAVMPVSDTSAQVAVISTVLSVISAMLLLSSMSILTSGIYLSLSRSFFSPR